MVGQNRTDEFFEYIRVQTKDSLNSNTSVSDTFEDSMIITTGKQMLFNIKQMHQMISENQSNYLELNRFLNPITYESFKHTHHSNKNNKIWTEDDRFKFENQILLFVKDITVEITDLTQLLDSSELKTDHDYISHQKNILKCLRFEVSALSGNITHLIKERSNTLRNSHSINGSKHRNNPNIERELDAFVDEIMEEQTLKNNKKMDEINSDRIAEIKLMNTKDLSAVEEEKYPLHRNDMNISNMEMQEFKMENEAMIKLLEEEHKEVTVAEQKTAEILDLLNLFTEQAMSQEGIVTSIGSAILGSLGDLELGNRELEKTEKRGKDAKTVFITVVVTLMFSLLFLDWYKT